MKKTALKLLGVVSPVLLALGANYLYDLRPIVRDVCEALLPFGAVVPQTEPNYAGDAGAR